MGILGLIIIGGLAGFLASKLVRGSGLGLLGDILVGVIGAVVGGLILGALGGVGITGFNLWSFFVAFIGAVVLLFIVRLFSGNRSSTAS